MPASKDRIQILQRQLERLGQRVPFLGPRDNLREKGLQLVSNDPRLQWEIRSTYSVGLRGLMARFDVLPSDMTPALSCGQSRETPVYGYPYLIATKAILDPALKDPSADILQRKPGTRLWFGTEIHFDERGRAGVFVKLPGEISNYGRFIKGNPIWRLVEGKLTKVELDFAEAALEILSP